MTAEEHEQWADTPEEFAQDETGEAWRYSLRPCAEHVQQERYNSILGWAIFLISLAYLHVLRAHVGRACR